MSLSIVIMAAGKGTRMKSARPKVLHKLAGRPMLAHVIGTTGSLQAAQQIVITGHGAELVEAGMAQAFPQAPLRFVRQEPQLGTGHAVQQAVPVLPDEGVTLILNGDTPLIQASTAQALVDACGGDKLALLTISLADPTGYGRIVRDASGERVLAIVEHKDATPEQRAIREVYTGMMAAPTVRLKQWLARLTNDNAQGEYYLTDVVAMAQAEGLAVVAAQPKDEVEVLGVNSPAQLAELERRHQLAQATALMEQGVRLADPARFDLRGGDGDDHRVGEHRLGRGCHAERQVGRSAERREGRDRDPFLRQVRREVGAVVERGDVAVGEVQLEAAAVLAIEITRQAGGLSAWP